MLDRIFRLFFKYPPLVFEQGDFSWGLSGSGRIAVSLAALLLIAALLTYRRTSGTGEEQPTKDRIILMGLRIGILLALVFCLLIGFLNGYLVMRTGIPSFLITLGTFFVLQGANLGVTKLVTGSVSSQNISQMDGFKSLNFIFAHEFKIGSVSLSITVIWWLLFVVLSAWILQRTKIGNWIFAVGGNAASARAVGVPVTRVKIGLFMTVSFLCWFTGMHYLYRFVTLQAGNGVGNEFLYIIAAVVGGTLLTGGYGNAWGVAIGAFIFGMTSLCIVYAGWDPNWFKAFLGVMLLLAVAVNLSVKKFATTRKA